MPRTIVGNIQADGDINDLTGHEEFSSDRIGQGTYMIDFRPPFRKIPVVQCTPVSSLGDATPEHGLLVASVAGVEKSRVKIVTGFVGGTGRGRSKGQHASQNRTRRGIRVIPTGKRIREMGNPYLPDSI